MTKEFMSPPPKPPDAVVIQPASNGWIIKKGDVVSVEMEVSQLLKYFQ